jgi:transmembrane sensor
MSASPAALAQAIDWHVALDGADIEGWRAFTEWLEADPAHQAAYDSVALDDALLTRPLPAAEPAQAPRRTEWRRLAVAAGIAATVGAGAMLLPRTAPSTLYAVETGRSASRAVNLADGSRIELNRSTRLLLDRANPRLAVLERGEALFRIKHDASNPFRLRTASGEIEDLGTVFDVVGEGPRLDVAVAEGAVMFAPEAQAIRLTPGMTLSLRGKDTAVVGRATSRTHRSNAPPPMSRGRRAR